MTRHPLRPRAKPPRRSRPPGAGVERLEGRALLTTFVVNTPLDSLDFNLLDGLVSLREAIIAANLNEPIGDAPAGNPGLDAITFDLPDPSVPIRLVAPLPTVTDILSLDGTTQPGFSGTPVVELDGSLAGVAADGLTLDASGNTVRGLVLNRFGGTGLIARSYDNLIAGNYIGTDRTGTLAAGNGLNGVELLFARNTVGGVSAADSNLISANGQAGLRISGFDASGNQVLGNRIGANTTLDAPLPNGTHGVFIDGASSNLIGSAAANYIWWNTGAGVQIVDGGISQPSARNAILGNSITGNGGLGIDLGGDGPSMVVKAPVLQSVSLEPGGLRVQGVFDAPPTFDSTSIFRLEFFTDAGDPSNFGQGRDLLGAIDLDAGVMGGLTNFSALLPPPPLGTLPILSATATGAPDGTSEFSANLAIPANLAVAMAPATSVGFTGDAFGLNIAMRSDGPAPASSSVLTVILPAGMDVVSSIPSRGVVSVAGQVLTLDLGTLTAKETASLALQVRPTLPGNQLVQAVFSSATPDPDPSDNTASASFDILSRADLAQTKAVSTPVVLRGDELAFILTTRNVGQVDAPIARVGDTLPDGFRIVSAVASRGTVFVTGQVVVGEFGLLEVGGVATLTIRVVADQAGTFLNTAVATSALPEQDPADNTATATVTVDDFDLVVRNTSDDGRNSLRRALLSAERLPGIDTVVFAIPGDGPHIITPLSPLPTLSEALVIDGSSQPTGEIRLDGSAAGTTSGLVLNTSDSEVNGLTIHGFAGSGITVLGDRNTLRANRLGLDLGSGPALGNALDGIEIRDGSANLVRDNLVIGNGRNGVLVAGPGATGNSISGNVIGVDRAEARALGNGEAGLLITDGASENWATANSISGNGTVGVGLYGGFGIDGAPLPGGAAGGRNIVQSSRIGAPRLENRLAGVLVLESPGNTIGGPRIGRNSIGGGDGVGVWIVGRAAEDNLISGNGISAGLVPFGPAESPGILIEHGASRTSVSFTSIDVLSRAGIILANGAAGTTIGPTVIGGSFLGFDSSRVGIHVKDGVSGTILAGNDLGPGLGYGIRLDAAAGPTRVVRNRFHTDIDAEHGGFPMGTGLHVESPGNILGAPGEGNSFDRNAIGLALASASASGNLIQGNWFRATGGIGVAKSGITVASADNTIGGASEPAANIITASGRLNPAGSAGIALVGPTATRNLIVGNWIGSLEAYGGDPGNFGDGIRLDNAPGNTVGGLAPGAENVLSGNGGAGLRLSGLGATGNQILGNRIGTDRTGTIAIPNQEAGIVLENASANTIGGTSTGAANLVSGNAGIGIELVGQGASANQILGNRIGTNAAGGQALPNATDGLYFFDAPSNVVAGNLISGNGSVGIQLHGGLTQSNLLLSNFIGTNAAGKAALPNRRTGVYVNDAPRNTIGLAGAGNLISGNGLVGVQLSGFGSALNMVSGNFIGTDSTGASRLSNGNTGVLVEDAPFNTIGGTEPGAGNVISGHTAAGVYLYGPSSSGNVVAGNRIGTDAAGARAIGNGNGVLIDGARSNLIGGPPGAGNQISGNELGLRIAGATAANNQVQSNVIGLAADGTSRLGNMTAGVFISGAPNNVIGGPWPHLNNTISANGGTGLQILGPGASGNVVQGNRIGTDAAGTMLRGNGDGGVFVNNAPLNTIGGSAAGQGNLIAGNREFAVLVSGRQARGNVVVGNQTSIATPRPSRVRIVRRPGR